MLVFDDYKNYDTNVALSNDYLSKKSVSRFNQVKRSHDVTDTNLLVKN